MHEKEFAMHIMKSTTAAALSLVLLATACTNVNTPTNNANQRTQEGALIGALTGAFLGSRSSGNKRQGAILGGIVGGVAGGAIGAQLDKQAAELQSSLDGRISVVNTGNELVVTMPQDILFAFDSAAIQPGLRDDLASMAGVLNRYPDSVVVVTGHTDNVGDADYNLDLSQRRAGSVASELLANGVSASRIQTIGRGEDAPIATNLTPEGRSQNRRVEVVIRPTP